MKKLVGAVALLCAASSMFAQQTTATLVGTVSDKTGGLISNVTIRATNLATSVPRDTVTDVSGNFTIPFLTSGNYEVSATSKGFKMQKVGNLSLQVGQTVRSDFQMQIGDVAESVTVEASGALLQTENATVGTVIDAQKIVDLPLNGRNFVQLAQLIPGVQTGTPGSITVRRGRGSIGQQDSAFGSTAMSANGSRDTANRYFLDGIEFMDYDAMTYSFSPPVDSLAEFKVETSTYSAESGGAPGGYINMLTKRGGNAVHGTLWEFNRNDALTQVYDAISNKDIAPPRLNAISTAPTSADPCSCRSCTTAKTRRSSSSTGNPDGSRRAPCPAIALCRQTPSAPATSATSPLRAPTTRSCSKIRWASAS